MQSQTQASYENPGRKSNHEWFPVQMEQAAPQLELLSPGELSKCGKSQIVAGRESNLEFPVKSPWLYLSLILLLGLLLL